jgi:NADH-quinone oxidoreductase subunit G
LNPAVAEALEYYAESERRHSQLVFIDPWPTIIKATQDAIEAATFQNRTSFVTVLSPMMTCEEAFVLAKYVKSVSKRATLAFGPVPVVGEDDCYPKNHFGMPPQPNDVRFTIRAEKCPNRIGVEHVLRHFEGEVILFESVVKRIEERKLTSAYVVGGYPFEWFENRWLSLFASMQWLIVQDFTRSPLSDAASILLPSATFAEREGTVVNHAGLAQMIRPAIRTPGDARPDGRILCELAGRTGLFNSSAIRKEMAREISAFEAFESGDLGDRGTFLKQPELVKA